MRKLRAAVRKHRRKAAVASVIFGLAGAGAINVFVGSDVIPGGAPDPGLANLWVVSSGAGSCTRSATAVAFNSGTSCTFSGALSASASGDTVLVRDGTYSGLTGITNSKGTPGVLFRAENPGLAVVSGSMQVSTGDWLSFEDFTINGSASCGPTGGCSNITFRQNRINGDAEANSGTSFNDNVSFVGNYINGRALSGTGTEDNDSVRLWGNTTGLLIQDNLIDGHDAQTGGGHTDFFQACAACDGGSRGDGIKVVGNWFIHGISDRKSVV